MYFIIFERNLYVKKKKTSKNETIKRETLISLINLIKLLTIEKQSKYYFSNMFYISQY